MLDAARDIFCIVNLAGYFTYTCPQFERALGVSARELTGSRAVSFVHPDDAKRTRKAAQALVRDGRETHIANRWVRPDGSVRWLEWTAWYDARSRLIYAAAQDVTEIRVTREQAALRRVATLVARGAPSAEMFAAVATEMRKLFGARGAMLVRFDDDGASTVMAHSAVKGSGVPAGTRLPVLDNSIIATMRRTGRSVRRDQPEDLPGPLNAVASRLGIVGGAKVPIVVQGRTWGYAGIGWRKPVPSDTEGRMVHFADLVAVAIANAESHDRLRASQARVRTFAAEQAALRRVATAVAHGAPPAEVFAAVAREAQQLLDIDVAVLERYEDDGTATIIALSDPLGSLKNLGVGDRVADVPGYLASTVYRTGRAARVDDYGELPGAEAAELRAAGYLGGSATPVMVDGKLWGAVGIPWRTPLSPAAEERLAEFTELVGTAIANMDGRARLDASQARLAAVAEEQSALRRVATLAAKGASTNEVFEAVTAELRQLLSIEGAVLERFEAPGTGTVVAISDPEGIIAAGDAVGVQVSTENANLLSRVRRTRRPALIGSYHEGSGVVTPDLAGTGVMGAAGVPVMVAGKMWGMAAVAWRHPVPEDTQARLAQFTALLGVAIANADSRDQLAESRARVVAASDQARQRIERDLHDSVQQRLIAVALGLRKLETDSTLRGDVLRIEQDLAAVMDEVRDIARGAHPPVLRSGGLGPALRKLVRRSRIKVLLDSRVDGRLPERAEVTAYYVVSESLTNAAKYSGADTIHVSLEARGSNLVLALRDNGAGGADPDKGTGLIGLRDRVEALGGVFAVSSPPGQGTSIYAEIPAHQDRPNRQALRAVSV